MATHRNMGIPRRFDADLPEGHPSLDHNGEHHRLDERIGLPDWFREYSTFETIPAADRLQTKRGIQPASTRLLPPAARRLVTAHQRVIQLALAAFVLAFITTVIAVALYDVAHRDTPVTHILAKGDRLK